MSINRNRAKYNKAHDGKGYHRLHLRELYPPYDETGWNWKTNISNHHRRAFKTWKHNRKNQWK